MEPSAVDITVDVGGHGPTGVEGFGESADTVHEVNHRIIMHAPSDRHTITVYLGLTLLMTSCYILQANSVFYWRCHLSLLSAKR